MREQLERLLIPPYATRRDASVPIWVLGELPWYGRLTHESSLARIKAEILALLWASGHSVFLVPPDDPPEADLRVMVERAGHAWKVRTTIDPEVFLRSDLNVGNWALYAAGEPLPYSAVPNTFRLADSVFLAFLREHGVAAYIDSFHDDDPWKIGINPDTAPTSTLPPTDQVRKPAV